MRFPLAATAACMLVSVACSHETGREHTRGRLRCLQLETSNIPVSGVSHFSWRLFFDDEPVEMRRASGFCGASPDPSLEALVLFRDAVRIESGRPVFAELHGNPEYALWACNDRCLVYRGGYHLSGGIDHIDTGTFEPFPALPGQPLSLSPDLHRVVSSLAEGDTTYHFCLLDLEARTATRWSVPRGAAPWLDRCPESIGPDEFSGCLRRRGARFRWQRGADGRDALVPPSEAVSDPATWENCASSAESTGQPGQ